MNKYTGAYIDRADFSQGAIVVNSCGNYVINDDDFVTFREHGTRDYQLIYLHAGEMIDRETGQTYPGNTALFFAPGQKHNYLYVAEKHTDVFWVHFGGEQVQEFLHRYQIDAQTVYRLRQPSTDIGTCFMAIIREITVKKRFFSEVCLAEFAKILISLCRLSSVTEEMPSVGMFQKAIDLMYMENLQNASVKRYADLYFLSVSRFAHAFKQATGLSPRAYHLQIIANKSKDFVLNSDLNIGEIAENLGFADIYYFSRFYKKYFGVSPNKHRAST